MVSSSWPCEIETGVKVWELASEGVFSSQIREDKLSRCRDSIPATINAPGHQDSLVVKCLAGHDRAIPRQSRNWEPAV